VFHHSTVNLDPAATAPESDTLGATPIIPVQPHTVNNMPVQHIGYVKGLLNFHNLQPGDHLVRIMASNGRTVMKKTLYITASSGGAATLDPGTLAKGLYTIIINSRNNTVRVKVILK
jgi:hypothetical protein